MKKTLVCATLFALSFFFIDCGQDKEPGPDLSSSKISFLYKLDQSPRYNFYVVIADTSGNVVEWDEIVPGSETELNYPSDPDLVTVTMITRINAGIFHNNILSTFAGVPPGKYTFTPTMRVDKPDQDGKVKLSIVNNAADFNYMPQYMTGHYDSIDVSTSGTTNTFGYGVYDNEVNNLFLWGRAHGAGDYKHLYIEDVNGGDSIGISLETFQNDFTVTPVHTATYPEHDQMTIVALTVVGMPDETRNYVISNWRGGPDDTPTATYPVIDNLFPKYLTEMISRDGDYLYAERNHGNSPDLNFSNMNTAISKIEKLTTKRISMDIEGDGEIVFMESDFSNSTDDFVYEVYAPMSSKIRMNLPKFPQDLVAKIPGLLEATDDRPFDFLYADEVNMAYADFYNLWVNNGFTAYILNMRAKAFDPSPTGRKSPALDVMERRFEKKSPFRK